MIPLKKTPAVERGEHRPPEFEHGTWAFAGADFKRKATTKYIIMDTPERSDQAPLNKLLKEIIKK